VSRGEGAEYRYIKHRVHQTPVVHQQLVSLEMSDSSDVMEGVSVSLLATGIRVTSDVEERQALFSLLANAVADRLESLTSEEVLLVSRLCLDHLLVAGGGSGGEKGKRDDRVLTLCLAALSNLTIPEANTNLFLSITLEKERYNNETDPDSPPPTPPPAHASHLTFMLTKFLEHNPQLEQAKSTEEEEEGEESSDCWEHVASVLCNLTQVEDGRRLLLRQSTGYMPKLVAQFRSKSVARRRGSVASFRSCLFDNEVHWWILHEVRALTSILLPLVVATPFTEQERKGMDPLLWMAAAEGGGGEAETETREEGNGSEGRSEYEQTRTPLPPRHEQQVDIVKMLLECLVLLCQRRGVREELRKRKVYPIVRNLDYAQEDEGVSEIINEVVQFMIRDEDESTPIDTPIDSVKGESFGVGGGGGGGGEQQRVDNDDVDEVD